MEMVLREAFWAFALLLQVGCRTYVVLPPIEACGDLLWGMYGLGGWLGVSVSFSWGMICFRCFPWVWRWGFGSLFWWFLSLLVLYCFPCTV